MIANKITIQVATTACLLLCFAQQSLAQLTNFTQFVFHSFYENKKYTNTTIIRNYTYSNGIYEHYLADCAQKCAKFKSPQCKAFNFYAGTTINSYICELVDDNYCFINTSRLTQIELAPQINGRVYELSRPSGEACIESQRYCKIKRNRGGCLGPNCTDYCARTCKEVADILKFGSGTLLARLWPDGTRKSEWPVYCKNRLLYLFLVLPKQGVIYNPALNFKYAFAFPYREINLVIQMGGYTHIKFNFKASDGTVYQASYGNITLTENGTLSMTYMGDDPADDGLDLINGTLKNAKFIQGFNDCGTFWLLNKGNSTCPGGDVRIVGRVDVNRQESGIRWPPATKANKLLVKAEILLTSD